MSDQVETVKVGQLRYLVAVLRDADMERIARRVVVMLKDEDREQAEASLEAEHRRQVPLSVIEEAQRQVGGEPFPIERVNGKWRVKP